MMKSGGIAEAESTMGSGGIAEAESTMESGEIAKFKDIEKGREKI
ncbi:hypothetical protein [Marvinbryantia formatexigens]|nr:hypothetical protein [Marvinbryantia formatexigens]UWO26685.1 hypothetical protein NQ534_09595 [Marvinbryantia formatexigens DSM 14469]